jgi:NAD(P)-dependent dehydrogenase (short-subunit alcohol dehydrogenase family)
MARGAGAVGCDLDVRRTDSVEAFHAAALNAFGKVDILINAAGVAAEQPICGHTEALWLDIIDTNLSGYFRTTRACLPGMIERGWGRIVNIASTAASVGAKDNPAYCASKSGILGLTRCVALEGAPHGVTCNAISPGFVNTKMMRASVRRWLAAEGNKRTEEEYIAGIAASYPRKSIIEPEEIGAVAAFLCRDESSGINAQDITVSTGALW